jgi:glycosyltransferase involved in cell wall biosynthesis
MKVLFVIPSLDHGGAARQLTLLARSLPRDRFAPTVAVLGGESAWGAELRGAGVAVEALGWRRPFDPRPFLRLRQTARGLTPDIIHAWGLPALRAVAAARCRGRVVLSAPLRGERKPRLGRLDRWLIGALVRRVAVSGPAEGERCRGLGVPADRLAEVPPAVAPAGEAPPHAELCRSLGLPRGARLVVAVGPLETIKGFRDAIWAFDILRFLYDDLHLLLAGTGPDEARLRQFIGVTQLEGRVHLLGRCPDVMPLLAGAEVVWVPSRADRGVNVALEAMAAGRPVLASRWPGLAEVVADGVTGLLLPPGDQGALARETRLLLDDPARRQRLGEAGRKRAADHFGTEALAARWAALYAEAAR